MSFFCSSGGCGNVTSQLQLGRTFNPKYTQYRGDGHGRDSYIIKHNGGLCHEREPVFSESTRFSSPLKCNYVSAPRKQVWSLKYISDGSGRDSYILINSGGNHVPDIPGG